MRWFGGWLLWGGGARCRVRFLVFAQLGAFFLQGFIFAAFDLPVFEGFFEVFIGVAGIAGDRVDAEMFFHVFKVVFLQPAMKHEPDEFVGGTLGVVGQDAEFDGSLGGVGGADADEAHGGVF